MAEKEDKKEPKATDSSKRPEAGRLESDPERAKALEAALKLVEKNYGKGAVQIIGGIPVEKVPVIPSGSLGLDIALGVGGYPRGRIVEIYGPEMTGKTTIALLAIAEAQKMGGVAMFIDAEHALDVAYAKALGVDVDNLWVSQPDDGEQALDILETMVRSGGVDIFVVDSVAALVPRAELEGAMEDITVGTQARLMSKALRKLTGAVSKSRAVVIFINQIRYKIGVGPYANPEVTTGGNALKFYASMRIEVRRSGQIKEGEEAIGHTLKLKVQKNKVAPPFKSAQIDLLYGKGIDPFGELVDLGLEKGIVKRSGSWYTYGDTQIGQGRDKAVDFLKEHPEIAEEIRTKIIEKAGLPV
ncbi:MAG: recombinase RecA [candidate division WOR-3 bacterium]